MKYLMDDAETVQKWGRRVGYVAVVVLWAVAFVMASGILR